MYTKVKTDTEIANMRESGRMLATVLDVLQKQVMAGMTTLEADALAAKELKILGGKPAFLHYQGFPNVLCASVNDEIVHGIPTQRVLNEGDVVKFDFGVNYRGMITDSAITTLIGGRPTTGDIKRLIDGTREALYSGVDAIKGGVRVGDLASSIEKVLKKHKLGIVRELVGHGVGHQIHEEPNIPNYGTKGTGPVIETGMTIAIEPMAMLGKEAIGIQDDGWTVVTADQSLTAHFEHTVLVNDRGAEILTTL